MWCHCIFRRLSRQRVDTSTTNGTMNSQKERFSRLSDFMLCMHACISGQHHCLPCNRHLICARIIYYYYFFCICFSQTIWCVRIDMYFSQSIPNFISLSGNKSIFLGSRFACKHNKELPVFLAKVLHLLLPAKAHTHRVCVCVCVSQTKFNYFIIFLGSDCEWMGRRSVYVIKSTCFDVVSKAWAPLEPKCSRISNNTLSFQFLLFFHYFFFFLFNFTSSPDVPFRFFYRFSLTSRRECEPEQYEKKNSTCNLNKHARK